MGGRRRYELLNYIIRSTASSPAPVPNVPLACSGEGGWAPLHNSTVYINVRSRKNIELHRLQPRPRPEPALVKCVQWRREGPIRARGEADSLAARIEPLPLSTEH